MKKWKFFLRGWNLIPGSVLKLRWLPWQIRPKNKGFGQIHTSENVPTEYIHEV